MAGAIRGSESANGVGVLAATYSGDASEGGGGVFGEGGDDLIEEERETVSHVCLIASHDWQYSIQVYVHLKILGQDNATCSFSKIHPT